MTKKDFEDFSQKITEAEDKFSHVSKKFTEKQKERLKILITDKLIMDHDAGSLRKRQETFNRELRDLLGADEKQIINYDELILRLL